MTAELAELNAVAATLPPALVRHLVGYAKRFQGPYWEWPGYSSEWTEEDMRDFTAASMRHFDEQHPDEEWGDLRPMNPGERYK
jgi:hypothetical protein